MKGKVTSLVLVGSAFLVALLTQDSSPTPVLGSQALTALVMVVWFGIMGAGLYLWSRYTRQDETPPQQTPQTQGNENFSLRQLAEAVGPSVPVTENTADTDNPVTPPVTQKS
jgi:hypothetical protein